MSTSVSGIGVDQSPSRAAYIPPSTYRVQLTADFTFADAARLVPYLAELGVGALYLSPVFTATPGSTHGYDVTNYGELNPELGGEEGFQALTAALRAHELGVLIDFVPNHMGISGGRNEWWQDVLENGPMSAAASYFDIEWRPLKRELRDKVLLPILGDQYGAVLERGELSLVLGEGAFQIQYFDYPLPIAPPTYPVILRTPLPRLIETLEADDPALLEYQSIITALDHLATLNEPVPEQIEERYREQIVAKRRLATLLDGDGPIAIAIAETIAEFNGTAGVPASFDRLDELLACQSYRLAYWRVAGEEINYRRFFAINELAAIRQSEPEVFARSHELLIRLLAGFDRAGVRIDHPDGLWDPAGYFRQLQAAYAGATTGETGFDQTPLYVVVEKILEHDEALPDDWAVHGTVGYEFATALNNLFVDSAHRRAFDDLYGTFIRQRPRLTDLVYEAKYLMMRTALVSEVNVLAQVLNRISEQDRHTRDFTLNSLRAAMREVIANFPVYRTYVTAEEPAPRDQDRKAIESAVARSRRRSPAIDDSVLDFLRDVLLGEPRTPAAAEGAAAAQAERIRFTMKLQQLSGPVMAKGLEDTAFYQYNRLVSLNEVGGNPGQFGAPVASFHRENAHRQRRWPHGMLTTSTHDTKRSEDVRARINVLSELPQAWRAAINRWARLNRKLKRRLDGRAAPDRNDEYLLYQTLLGTWPVGSGASTTPDYVARIVAFSIKAAREAQLQSSWLTPNEPYEAALTHFIEGVLNPAISAAFLTDFGGLAETVAYFGALNGLSQQTLKLTSPGVPDLYQGTELWDDSLVDPDNRRPVDYEARTRLLEAVSTVVDGTEVLDTIHDGRVKLFVTRALLGFRRQFPELFAAGDYQPLEAIGERADHLCAFRRQHRANGDEVVVIVPRLIAGLMAGQLQPPVGSDVWGDTVFNLGEIDRSMPFRNVLTGEIVEPDEAGRLTAGAALATFPVAVLDRMRTSEASGA